MINKSLQLFANGYSCAQSILVAFASAVNIDHDLAFSIGAGLGGGIGRTQNICGAINAGAIILGLKFGRYNPSDAESKNRMANLVHQFVDECKQTLGATQCLDLIKVDLNNKEQIQSAQESGQLSNICNNAVLKTAEILTRYLQN